ncbi:MAG: glutaredoxin 3 [Bdellovibrionaceae bacterium]|nr:glutaredoxin 3 [Bdellovibrionales bacterium]MCB9083118.1 glutaredoxin 3 [Pseudobdellovibrionaceae bacterium]
MAKVTIYTWTVCPYCVRAKNLLNDKGVTFEEINLDGKDDELQALRARTGFKTIPQIFIGEEFIGGYSDLAALEDADQLDAKLNA